MAAANAICFDGLPFGMRAGYMGRNINGQCQWTPTAAPRRPRVALDIDVEIPAPTMAGVIKGYGRLGGPAR